MAAPQVSARVRNSDGLISPWAVLHTPSAVNENSPTLELQANTFNISSQVIGKLRDYVIGDNWRAGAQKYAFAAAALGVVRNVSSSVEVLGFKSGKCGALFTRWNQEE
jgi:hypothetical protein